MFIFFQTFQKIFSRGYRYPIDLFDGSIMLF